MVSTTKKYKTVARLMAFVLAIVMCIPNVSLGHVQAAAGSTYVLDVTKDLTAFAQGAKADGASETAGTDSYFTVYYSAKNKVDSSKKSFSDGYSATQRLNFGGKTDLTVPKNAVAFTTEGAATVTLHWVSGGDNRQMYLLDSEGTTVAKTSTSKKNDLYIDTLNVTAAGTYYIAVLDGSNYLFKATVAEAASGATPTTAPTTAPTTEPAAPTAEPTTAPAEPTGTPAATAAPGTSTTHNFTTDGWTSDFYTFSSGHKTGLDVTVDGTTYTQGLKLNSSGEVTFTSAETGTLTLILTNGKSGSGISVDGTTYAVEETTMTITVKELAAGEHTIVRTNGETYLLYIGLSYDGKVNETADVKHRAELSGDIGLTFAFPNAPEGSYVKFAYNNKEVSVEPDSEVTEVIGSTEYRLFSCKLYATEMNEEVTATLYDSSDKVLNTDTCSVTEYCKNILSDTNASEELKNAVNALLLYGAEAYKYFGQDAAWLSNITDASLEALTDAEKSALKQNYVPSKIDGEGYDTSDITLKATTLFLDTKMAVREYFKAKDGSKLTDKESLDNTYTFAVSADGEEWSYATGVNNNGYYLEILNIGPRYLDAVFTVKVMNGEAVVQTVTYSPFTYVSSKMNDAKHTDLVTAIYRYNKALEMYSE